MGCLCLMKARSSEKERSAWPFYAFNLYEVLPNYGKLKISRSRFHLYSEKKRERENWLLTSWTRNTDCLLGVCKQ